MNLFSISKSFVKGQRLSENAALFTDQKYAFVDVDKFDGHQWHRCARSIFHFGQLTLFKNYWGMENFEKRLKELNNIENK